MPHRLPGMGVRMREVLRILYSLCVCLAMGNSCAAAVMRRLEKLSLMTDAGRAVLPAMGVRSYKLDADVEAALKQVRVYSKFKTFPALYQRTRGYNVSFYKKRAPETYEKMLARLISETKQGKMFGEWNDYGRLLNY